MDAEIIGFLAAILTTSAFVPQVIKVWKSKSSKGVSVTMYLVMLSGVILWGTYGYLIGKEIALQMLADHGIKDVKVISTPGMLTDHYNPKTKTVNLSEGVYSQRNASAAAVAAHECGHAVQHAIGYEWLQMRSTLVPMVSVASNFSMYVIFGGLFASQTLAFGQTIAMIGVGLYGLGTL